MITDLKRALTLPNHSTFLVDNGNELNACSIEKIRWDKIKECVPLFEEMADLIHHRRSPMRMKFDHCQGHSDIYGNEQADKAAKEMTQRMYLDALNQSNINPNNFPLLHRCPTRVLTRTYLLPVLLPVCNSNLLLSMPTRRSMSSHQTEILFPPTTSKNHREKTLGPRRLPSNFGIYSDLSLSEQTASRA